MNSPHLVHRLKQSIWDYNIPPLNQMDNLSWSSIWVSHDEYTNVHDYTLNKSGESWHWLSSSHNFTKLLYFIVLNLKRILNKYWGFQWFWPISKIVKPHFTTNVISWQYNIFSHESNFMAKNIIIIIYIFEKVQSFYF